MQTQQGPYQAIDWNYLVWLTMYFEKEEKEREKMIITTFGSSKAPAAFKIQGSLEPL